MCAFVRADEKSQVSGRVKALREMFNKGGSSGEIAVPEKKAAPSMQFNKRVVAPGMCCSRGMETSNVDPHVYLRS